MRWAECYSALLQSERMRDKREEEKDSDRAYIRETDRGDGERAILIKWSNKRRHMKNIHHQG